MITEEGAGGDVVKFAAVVGLKSDEGKAELGECKGMETTNGVKRVRLATKGKRPGKVTEII